MLLLPRQAPTRGLWAQPGPLPCTAGTHTPQHQPECSLLCSALAPVGLRPLATPAPLHPCPPVTCTGQGLGVPVHPELWCCEVPTPRPQPLGQFGGEAHYPVLFLQID